MSTNMSSKTWIATGRNVPSSASSCTHRRSVTFTLLAGTWDMLRAGFQRAWQRQHLTGLTDHQLRDIGLHRWDVELELRKPFWRE